jgi:CARDB protein
MKLLGASTWFCFLLLLLTLPLSAQGPAPDFSITNFSVWSTLPSPDGTRRLAISFRVTNSGTAPGGSMRTRITIAGTPSEFTIPTLSPQQSAFLTRTLSTSSSQLAIKVEADVFHVVQESNESNNVVEYTANPGGDVGRWQNIGPSKITENPSSSGRVTTIAVSPISPFTVFAGARDSGLWKTTGQTTSWFPITDSLPTQQIDAVAIDPTNTERVVIATPSGLFQSLDSGSLWRLVTSQDLQAIGSDGGRLLIASTPNPPMYVSANNGLKVSTNGGQTWSTVLASGSPVLSLQFSTTDPTHLFTSTARPPAVFEAQSRGLTAASWHKLQGCPDGRLPEFPSTSNVWITESQGTQWVSFRTGSPDPKIFELWRSTSATCNIDGFTEHGWEKLSFSGACNDYNTQWSYIFAHPSDPSVVFKGGLVVCRSSASGEDMQPVSGIHADQHAIMVAPSAPAVMFFGSDGGIYRSPDKGATMHFLGEGMSNGEFLKIDVNGLGDRVIVGGTQDNGTSVWDGSLSPVWKYIAGGDSALVAFDRKDLRGIYEMGQSTRQLALHPSSGGSSGKGSDDLADCIAYSEFPGQVFDGMESTGGSPELLVTCGGIWSGPPWKQIKPATQGNFSRLRLAPDNLEIGVAGTTSGHVFWGAVQQPSLFFDVFTAPNGGGTSAIAMSTQSLFYVANNANAQGIITRFTCFFGCSTENIWPGTPAGDVTALAVDPLAKDTVLAAIKGNGVFRGTRDSAGHWSWIPYSNGIPVAANVTDLEARKNGSIAAALYGRGVFLLTSTSTGGQQTQSAVGFLVEFEESTEDFSPGHPPQRFITASLDSKPGFTFTATNLAGTSASVLRQAFKNHRRVEIQYKPSGQNSGKIIKATRAGL